MSKTKQSRYVAVGFDSHDLGMTWAEDEAEALSLAISRWGHIMVAYVTKVVY